MRSPSLAQISFMGPDSSSIATASLTRATILTGQRLRHSTARSSGPPQEDPLLRTRRSFLEIMKGFDRACLRPEPFTCPTLPSAHWQFPLFSLTWLYGQWHPRTHPTSVEFR